MCIRDRATTRTTSSSIRSAATGSCPCEPGTRPALHGRMQQIDTENGSDLTPRHDSLALLLEYARQDDGGPYRSRREALLERRRRLTEELAAIDRVWAQRRAALL